MRNNRKLLVSMFIGLIVVLSGCGNSSAGKLDEFSNDEHISTEADSAESGKVVDDLDDADDERSHDEETLPNRDNELTDSQREDYLQKLNEMEEEDRYSEVGTTMQELEQQEAERYEKWDDELNRIYGILQEQLSSEQMDELREEQRSWIDYRDETAKESSLKYEGGSTESLEYIATLASLTRERCYVLVAHYMN